MAPLYKQFTIEQDTLENLNQIRYIIYLFFSGLIIKQYFQLTTI